MLSNLDLNKLKVFYYIYTEKSVIHAAQRLHVTPSAVSQQIKKLEDEIGITLFTRMHKRLVPTGEAEKLITLITPFFHELVGGIQELQSGREAVSGVLRIGAPVEFGKEYFPRLISTFRKRYPLAKFSLTLGNTEKILDLIKEGRLDFAAVDLFLGQKQYVSELGVYSIDPLVDEKVVLACSKEYYNEHITGDTSVDNLLQQQFISYDHSYLAINGWFKHHFDRQGVKVDTVLTVDSVQAVVAAIKNDIGLGVVTDNVLPQYDGRGGVVPILTDREDIINKISLVQLLDKIPTYTEKKFQAHLCGFFEKE
jgi:DNA-binding transcriptional LysR family regulator